MDNLIRSSWNRGLDSQSLIYCLMQLERNCGNNPKSLEVIARARDILLKSDSVHYVPNVGQVVCELFFYESLTCNLDPTLALQKLDLAK